MFHVSFHHTKYATPTQTRAYQQFEGTRLKVLRVEENCLSEISSEILKNSTISTFYFDGNLFDKKKIENTEGYEEYSKRYTQSKQKAEWLILYMILMSIA